jgi:hypothetical protein
MTSKGVVELWASNALVAVGTSSRRSLFKPLLRLSLWMVGNGVQDARAARARRVVVVNFMVKV